MELARPGRSENYQHSDECHAARQRQEKLYSEGHPLQAIWDSIKTEITGICNPLKPSEIEAEKQTPDLGQISEQMLQGALLNSTIPVQLDEQKK